jgi:hypothetical protein
MQSTTLTAPLAVHQSPADPAHGQPLPLVRK